MPLESLRQPFDPEQAGHKLREVQVEHEHEHESAAKQKFDKLKSSGFYDSEKHRWRMGIDMLGCNAQDQFFGMLALVEFDVNSAKLEWKDLSAKEKYDPKSENWMWDNLTTNMPDAKYTSLIVQMIFERQKALQEYELLCGKLSSHEAQFVPQPLDEMHDVHTRAEFLHLILQSEIDLPTARNRYKALQATKLYDASSGLWNSAYFWYDNSVPDTLYSDATLLSFLVELKLGIPGVAERYEAAKSTPLFDQNQEQWNHSQAGDSVNPMKYSNSQLLSVIVDSRLEKLGQKELTAPIKLPEERNF